MICCICNLIFAKALTSCIFFNQKRGLFIMQMTALAPLFNMLPTPIIVLQDTQPCLNHRVVFMNQRFVDMIGWTSEDIPDKDTWWENAYPDLDYQKVVARQWELEMASAIETDKKYVSMQVNIATKYNGFLRFKVYTQFDFILIPNHYIVVFEPIGLDV
jgi:PAS domain-containing protein